MSFPGIYKARVLVRLDPEKQHRIKVDCPQVYGSLSAEQVPWAYPAGMPADAATKGSPFSGAGEAFVPPLGSPVWVMFEGGDTNFPVWFHGWWANPKLSPVHPPEHAFDNAGDPNNRYFTTPRGTTVQLDDREGKEKILLRTPEGDYIVIDVPARTVDVWAETTVRIRSAKTVDVQAADSVIVRSANTIDLYADGVLSLFAQRVNISAQEDVNITAGGDVNWEAGKPPTPPGIKVDTEPSQDGK